MITTVRLVNTHHPYGCNIRKVFLLLFTEETVAQGDRVRDKHCTMLAYSRMDQFQEVENLEVDSLKSVRALVSLKTHEITKGAIPSLINCLFPP